MFSSFFMAGFECSSHRRPDGVRLDLVRSTGHAGCVAEDYRACAALGLSTVRDGLRWHLIEGQAGRYDWSSWDPMLEAAVQTGTEVIWDVCHYGFPDHLELGSDRFLAAFADFAGASALRHREVTGCPGLFCPMNEISFFTWAVNTGYFPLLPETRPGWLKRRLVRAALAAVTSIRAADPAARFFWAEPLINIVPRTQDAEDVARASQLAGGQFEAIDMLLGLAEPQLGGGPHAADAVGVNYYPENQWIEGGSTIPFGNFDFRPLSELLAETHRRFGKPLFLSETGAERSGRAAWLHYVCDEVRAARRAGVPVMGICIYPVTSFPGWDDSRHAEVGLFSTPHADGTRRLFAPLAEELRRQQALFAAEDQALRASLA